MLTHLKNIYCSGVYDVNKNDSIDEYWFLINFTNDSRLQCFDHWEKVFTHKNQDKGGTVHMPFMLQE